MYQEIMWYVDDNRFSDIVRQTEELAAQYQDNYDPQSLSPEHIEAKKKFVSFISYHASKSGYAYKLPPNTNIVETIVPKGRVDRKALDNFEKEIIKNHMYQKHLWEFMGTTSSFGIITKIGLSNSNKNLDEYLPLSYKEDINIKSPIASILDDIPDSVPIYLYFDGTASTLYDKNRALEAFDTTIDRSGFNWDMKGYDPNYLLPPSVKSDILYDPKKDCFSSQSSGTLRALNGCYSIFRPELPEPIKLSIMKIRDSVILKDPFYLYIFKAYFLSKEDKFSQYISDILDIFDSAMSHLDVEKITHIVKYKSDVAEDEILQTYKKILGKRADKLSFMELEVCYKEQKNAKEQYKLTAIKEKGEDIATKLDYLISLGITGQELESAISTGAASSLLSYQHRADLDIQGLSDDDIDYISALKMPDDCKAEFNHTLFNMLMDYPFFSSSIDAIDMVNALYNKTVGKEFEDRNVDVSSTLSRTLGTSSTIFDSPSVDPIVEERILIAFEQVPDFKKTEILKKAVRNAAVRYDYINMNTGMSEKELVNAAVTIFYDNFAPTSTIKYIKGSDPVNQMMFSKIKLSKLLEKERDNTNQYKSIKPINYSQIKKKSKYNILDDKGLDGWLESANGKKSGLTLENFERIKKLFVDKNGFKFDSKYVYPKSREGIPLSANPIKLTPLSAQIRISNFLDPYGTISAAVPPVMGNEADNKKYNITQNGILGFACKMN